MIKYTSLPLAAERLLTSLPKPELLELVNRTRRPKLLACGDTTQLVVYLAKNWSLEQIYALAPDHKKDLLA